MQGHLPVLIAERHIEGRHPPLQRVESGTADDRLVARRVRLESESTSLCPEQLRGQNREPAQIRADVDEDLIRPELASK